MDVLPIVEVQSLVLPFGEPPELSICWDELPEAVDPKCGELQRERAERKRKQVESLAAYALAMMGPQTKAEERVLGVLRAGYAGFGLSRGK